MRDQNGDEWYQRFGGLRPPRFGRFDHPNHCLPLLNQLVAAPMLDPIKLPVAPHRPSSVRHPSMWCSGLRSQIWPYHAAYLYGARIFIRSAMKSSHCKLRQSRLRSNSCEKAQPHSFTTSLRDRGCKATNRIRLRFGRLLPFYKQSMRGIWL